MSVDIVKTVKFSQAAFQYVPQEILGGNAIEDFTTLGGILSDLKHLWQAKGPCLEVRNIAGRKVGSWTFGGILNDSNTKIIAVDELKRPHGRLSLLVVALECTISGGLICVFDIFGSKVLRVVQVREQITSLHVIDSGCENSVLPEPSPLRYFDGIVAVGMLGGNVYLLDICRQICENGIHNVDITIRDELNPCPMIILNKEKIANIKKYVERSVDREEHLAIHLNVIVNPSTEHFTLKGEDGEDRVHVNRLEAEVSSLFYSSQIASLLVGHNFGAFQLWNLRSLELIYTSPVCEEHIPVMHFSIQEPADDPKAYCYIWVSYSHNLMFNSGFPFAVMYSFYYENKNYVNGYGNLYEDFQHCSVRFQIELGDTDSPSYNSRIKGGTCIGLQSLNRYPINKDLNSLSLCLITWLVWNSYKEVNTSMLVFDLNQWYKEQMPRVPNWSACSNYIIKHTMRNQTLLDVKLDQKSLRQFIGIQRLEEHFCTTALSFDLWCITENKILKVHNKGLQRAFLDKIINDQHLSLVRPEDYFDQISSLGLVPLFCEMPLSTSLDVEHQREILLNVALEQKLIGWLCQCTSKLANNAFNASGLTIYNILNWALERAIALKNSCDKYCVSLFDYSGTRLDNNTITILNSSTGQIRNICSLYRYVSGKLMRFVSDKEVLLEEQRSLENVVVYFEVLLWMVNIGLLPECQIKNYRLYDDSFTSAPYLVNELTQYYNRKRAELQMASHDSFVKKDCLLYIDNLINIKGGAEVLGQQWQEDGGSGLYPPPSLQSVLRTYFLDGPDLIFKHCFVTYTLLDIAMTVDENNKVIKLLLKFPQIFDLSQSNIKIVQAFWHLDHDDHETALEYILDPCVLTEDLHHWHHSVMMRSLLLQDKSSLALLYLQIRKPSIQDEEDLLTVISLLISKNMLDEAFKFRQQHQNTNEHTLLLHIFNECNKNELLHSLLYRQLNNGEEKAFFRYLQSTNNPRCEDLKVFYYLLRSRFLEAFDSYSLINRKKPENQGLIGQRDATTADNIVKMFRTLLPDVNKNLVELVRKERNNLWKEVKKPTPLSVFVHNAQDQIQYKSSVIFAALAKAKQTFNDTLNDETRVNNDLVTEETPFLRTPTVFRSVSNVGTPLMRSKIIEQNEHGDEYGPSPCKKLKLSPRTSKTTPLKSRQLSVSGIQSKFSTPIIRRKRLSTELNQTTTALPQSILKGSSATRTFLDDSILDENTSVNTSLQLECENSVRRSRLALSPRKPLSRTPLKSHVKFEDLSYSSSSREQSSKNDSTLQQLIPETSRSLSVNSDASTVDEIFYSPENSPEHAVENSQKQVTDVEEKFNKKSLSPVREKLSFDKTLTEDDVFMDDQSKKRSETSKVSVEDNDLSTNRLTFQSPRSRRSYKRSFGESPIPVRSSPRLAKKISQEEQDEVASSETTINKSESLVKPSPSVAVQKIRGRKSLSRAVLENNAFSKLQSENLFEERSFSEAKSGISSLNTTTNDSKTDMDKEPNLNASLEAFLAKYGTSSMESDSSVNENNSFDSSSHVDIFKDEDVVSKTTEVRNVATHSESLRNRDTQELISSRDTREEYHSKKVEVSEQDQENSVGSSIFDESTQEYNKNLYRNVDDDKKSESENSEVLEEQKSLNQEEGNDKNIYQHEEINVYDDLSSGSDDVSEVVKQFMKKKDHQDKTYADISFSTSASYYQSEKKDELMPDNLMDSGDSSNNDDSSKSLQPEHVYDNDVDMEAVYDDIPVSERAFIGNDVIEIGSSSDEDDKQTEKRQESDESTQSSSTSSSSEDKSYFSKEESNDYAMNVAFEDNLNESRSSIAEDDSNDVQEVHTTVYDVDKKIEEDRQTGHDSGKETKDTSKNLFESLKSGDKVSTDDQQIEFDQQEIAAALKMIQANTVAVEEIAEADDEHMDSLILDEQSPEKDIPNAFPLEPKNFEGSYGSRSVTIVEEQKVVESDGGLIENPLEKEADSKELFENDKSETLPVKEHVQQTTDERGLQKNEDTPLKVSKSLQCTLGDNDSSQESPEKDSTKTVKIIEKEAPTLTVKKSISIQSTIGANITSLEPLVEDNASVFQEDGGQEPPNMVEIPGSSVKKSIGLQCTLGANDTLIDTYVEDSAFLKGNKDKNNHLTEKEPISASKHTISLQCTLGANDSVMETSVEDSVFLKDNEIMDLSKGGVAAVNKDKNVDLTQKEPSVPARKHTIGLQCTLGANDSIMDTSVEDSVFLKENNESLDLSKGGVAAVNKDKNVDLTEKEPSVPAPKHTISLQCTLGANDSIMDTSVEDSVFLKDNESLDLSKGGVAAVNKDKNVNLTEKEPSVPAPKHTISLQCTLGANDSIMDTSVEDYESMDLSVRGIAAVNKAKNVDLTKRESSAFASKHTISLQCTLGANDSIDTSIEDSVFLKDNESIDRNKGGVATVNKDKSIDLTKKEASASASKHIIGLQCTFGANDSILDTAAEDSGSKGNKNVTLKEDVKDTPNIAVDLTTQIYSRKDLDVSNTLLEKDETVTKDEAMKEKELAKNEEPSIAVSIVERNKTIKDLETKENVIRETSDSTQDTLGIIDEQDKESARPREENTTKSAPSMRMTRRRSVLLSQQEGTPGSTSEKSVDSSSSGGDVTSSQEVKEQLMETSSETNQSQSTTSQTTMSQTPSSRRITRLSHLSESMFDSIIVTESPVVRVEPDIMEMTVIGTNVEPRGESDGVKEKESSSAASPSQLTMSQTPTSRRITRLSQLSESMFDTNVVDESPVVRVETDIMETTLVATNVKPRVQGDVLEIMDEGKGVEISETTPGPSKIKSRRSSKDSSRDDPFTAQKPAPYSVPKKRARSASVDQPLTNIRKRSMRSKSIDLDDLKIPPTVGKTELRVFLTPIQEQAGPSTEEHVSHEEVQKQTTKAFSDVGAYTTSRRLTRRQASMLRSIGKVERQVKLASVEELDPLHLLDKAEFAGKPDPDESKVYEQPSPSNSSENLSRHTRSASVLSDVPSLPTKRGAKAKTEHVDSPISGIKTRLRRQSADTMSVASEQSDSPSPSKKAKKKDDKNDSPPVKSSKGGRGSRASSVSSTKSAASDKTESSVRTTRSRLMNSAKSDLPEIKEEKDSEEGEVNTSVIKRRGRKKKQ